ncbi:MAG: hypothetical protein ACKOE5_03345 [Cytophagales bacterium]
MISLRIRTAIEGHLQLTEDLLDNGFGTDWKKFNRTVFDFIANRINRAVTGRITSSTFLVTERLIIGQDHLDNLLFDKKLKDEESLIHAIANSKRTFHWLSGKTLHSYWHGGKAKETKLNVLLVFLGIDPAEWEEWKSARRNAQPTPLRAKKSVQQDVLKNYFLGNYHLYYQKSDGSNVLIKAPFVIERDANDQVVVQTITEGHLYKSSLVELREGILYIHLENQFFNDKENHIFNVGNETNPEVIFGISNTITVKSKLAIGLRNVLIKQKRDFSPPNFEEKELAMTGQEKLDDEENLVCNFFRKQKTNQLNSYATCSREEMRSMLN